MRPLVLLLALAGCTSSAAEPANPFAGIPGVTLHRYTVTGTTADAVRAAMNRLRPTDPNDGTRVDAGSLIRMSGTWRGDGHGGCDLSTLQITFTAAVTLPRLADRRAPAALREQWDRFILALARHEANHVRHAWASVPKVIAAMRNGPCDGINARGDAALAEVFAWDREYDRRTNHGEREGIRFP